LDCEVIVSVVICTYNRAPLLLGVVASGVALGVRAVVGDSILSHLLVLVAFFLVFFGASFCRNTVRETLPLFAKVISPPRNPRKTTTRSLGLNGTCGVG